MPHSAKSSPALASTISLSLSLSLPIRLRLHPLSQPSRTILARFFSALTPLRPSLPCALDNCCSARGCSGPTATFCRLRYATSRPASRCFPLAVVPLTPPLLALQAFQRRKHYLNHPQKGILTRAKEAFGDAPAPSPLSALGGVPSPSQSRVPPASARPRLARDRRSPPLPSFNRQAATATPAAWPSP